MNVVALQGSGANTYASVDQAELDEAVASLSAHRENGRKIRVHGRAFEAYDTTTTLRYNDEEVRSSYSFILYNSADHEHSM